MDEQTGRSGIEGTDTAVALNEMCQLAIRHLTPPRGDMSFTARSTLSRLDRDGPSRLSSLAAAEGVAQPSMTQLVQRLETQGLVLRTRDAEDGRVVLVAITDEGRVLLDQRRLARIGWLADLLTHLEPAEQRTLAAALDATLPLLRRLAEVTQTTTGTADRPRQGEWPRQPAEVALPL